MIGSFLTRGLVMVFGYAYPAYECYKTVERNKPDIEQLRFWCQYWILVAFLTVFERVCDTFVFWVPMYSEAKLAFYIYLWYPKTKVGVFQNGVIFYKAVINPENSDAIMRVIVSKYFRRPYVAKHETDIDRNLLELRTRAGDYAVLYWQRAFSFAQTRIFDILQYIAAQSTSRPRPQPKQQSTRARQATAPPNKKPSAKVPPPSEEPPSPTSSASLSEEEEEAEEIPESIASQALKVVSSISNSSLLRSTSVTSETSPHSNSNEVETKSIEEASTSSVDKPEISTAEETVMEEAVRVTRARLRKNRSIPSDK